MAEAAAKKKRGRPPKNAPDTIAMGKTDGDPNQGQLDGMEEERIPEIETTVSSIVKNKTRILELQNENKEHVDNLAELLHDNGLTTYRCCGRVVTIAPGEETIVIKVAKGSK